MLKDKLAYIKNDMREVRSNRKYLHADIKMQTAEIERDRKEALKANGEIGLSEESLAWFNRKTNEGYDKRRVDCIWNLYDQYHNDQSYYLIYKDGSEVCISAEDILAGDTQFPKMSGIVYAEIMSADEWTDTEVGDLDEYLGDNGSTEYDDRKDQYETAIAFKYGTAWSHRYAANHPDFVPMTV